MNKSGNKIRVGAVSYLNTKPLTYSLEKGMMDEEMALRFDFPSRLASGLQSGELDLALLPVAVIPSLAESHVVSDYCIGTDGEVASVCLFSDVPLEEIASIYLDYQSRTSVELLKILLSKYWKINPQLLTAVEGYEMLINNKAAGLIIGDRALEKRKDHKYIYDLGAAWKEMTGLPFVFAAWVANKELPADFIKKFNLALAEGLKQTDTVISELNYPYYNLETYYRKNISYSLDEEKRKGMNLFLLSI